MIADAWNRHCRDREHVSKDAKEVLMVMNEQWEEEMSGYMNETFLTHIDFGSSEQSLVKEIFTATERVSKEAMSRGHKAGSSVSLEFGWNLLDAQARRAAFKQLNEEKPKFVLLAFPCGPWSPLTRLRQSATLEERQAAGKILIEFALVVAKAVRKWGGHFVVENPKPSAAWKLDVMQKFINEMDPLYVADFDQCRLHLKSASGHLHKKPTRVLTSSSVVYEKLHELKCLGNHVHQPVIGGSKVTQAAGHYPGKLAKVLVNAMEQQVEADLKGHEVHAVEEPEGEELAELGGPFESESDVSEDGSDVADEKRVSAGVKLAVKRLHENTGHRSNRRLARALVLSGAPSEVIRAAKQLRCSICDEKRKPKARLPSSLPTPKDVSDQVHLDIFEVVDSQEKRFYVVHAIDWSSRFQMAEALPDKSSESVVDWFQKRWLPIFGPPRVLVADQGREFISWAFEEMCARHSILLWHIPVQAPWAHGICEKGGGILKALISACVKSHSVLDLEEMNLAVQESVAAYNGDVNEMGVTPAQAAIGRQPRMNGDVLGSFQQRLAEHGLLESRPGLARQVAIRETAKLAMVRLHFSKGLRRAQLARSRNPLAEQHLAPGDIAYFWRESRYNSRTAPSKKRLSLRRWHGPALLVALEGERAGFVSFKGQLTKCAREHLRPASSMEQVSADVWHEAIQEAVEAALWDVSRPADTVNQPQPEAREAPAAIEQPIAPLPVIVAAPRSDDSGLVPSVVGDSAPVSRRSSSQLAGIPAPGTPVPELIRQASQVSPRASMPSLRMQSLVEDAAELESEQMARKRVAEVSPEDLRDGEVQGEGLESSSSRVPMDVFPPDPGVQEINAVNMEEIINPKHVHPLKLIEECVLAEKKSPLDFVVHDHGTWRGDWPLPSRSDWWGHQICKLPWPRGSHEAFAVKTARRELKWKEIPEKDKSAFHEAAAEGWQVWVRNDAVEVLGDEESRRIRNRIQNGSANKILCPRFVLTDKHDGVRTESNPLPLKANARLVVPGYLDSGAYSIRKDAPTSNRTSQHLMLIFTASFGWSLYSADVKSAFLKGEEFEAGERVLYISNVRLIYGDEPTLPFGRHGLARLKKGVFGLADSPRRWYLRLHKSLTKLGWVRSRFDAAMWTLRDERGKLHGIVLSHVDDLLLGGDSVAKDSLDQLGAELGFGSLETGSFSYCGKEIKQLPDKSIEISMKSYHENMSTVPIAVERRKHPEARLTPAEQRQLRGILGSLQWLVAQVRFDQGYQLSVLQGAPQTIGTLMKANALVKQFKQNVNFKLVFKGLDLSKAGVMVVSDASLGNVTRSGHDGGEPLSKTYSQSAYFVLVASKSLMNGEAGRFAVLDARSHRISRICRSTYGAELLGAEEGLDAGIYCRGLFSELLGYDVTPQLIMEPQVSLKLVVDAKDVYDKCHSDTPSYGSQKSLAFTVAWIREELRKEGTDIAWTATSNMFVDCGTKEMDQTHVQKILRDCVWCIKHNEAYVKQTGKNVKSQKAVIRDRGPLLPGQLLATDSPMLGFLMKLAEKPGWHMKNGYAIHVAKNAKSYRHPSPRFSEKDYPFRSTYGRFDDCEKCEWRMLEKRVALKEMPLQKAIGDVASILVTLYSPCIPISEQQKKVSAVKAV